MIDSTGGSGRRLTFVSHGARIAIESDSTTFLDALASRLPPRARRTSSEPDMSYSVRMREVEGRVEYSVSRGGEAWFDSPDEAGVVDSLASAAEFQVAVHARRRLFVHAGVVGWNGRAIVVPGRTFSGKSTLVAALIRAGATYYSDEFAVLDREGLVHPFARPLSLRTPDGKPAGRHTPQGLGATVGRAALPIGLVVSTRFEAGAEWAPRPRSRADALMALFDNTVVARRRPELALATLEAAVSDALAVEGVRGEADRTATAVLNLCSGAPA